MKIVKENISNIFQSKEEVELKTNLDSLVNKIMDQETHYDIVHSLWEKMTNNIEPGYTRGDTEGSLFRLIVEMMDKKELEKIIKEILLKHINKSKGYGEGFFVQDIL